MARNSNDIGSSGAGDATDAERIAKVIARAGLCSRRDAEQWIAAGRVSVNGAVITTPALNVTGEDRIRVDGEPLPQRERTRLFLYHKPVGLITTNDDPQRRPTIFGALPKTLPRLLTVGRLDVGTEGLLLLTNDGGLARVLELPETGWLRRYRVRAHGTVTQQQLDRLREGLTVDGMRYGPIEATLDRAQSANVWLTFAIREGKNREVRNVLRAIGLQVNRLIRISFGPFQLGELPQGAVEEVTTRILRDQLGPRIAESAGCDFSAPIIAIPAEERITAKAPRPDARRELDARTPIEGKTREDRSERKSPRHARGREKRRGPPGYLSRDRRTMRSDGPPKRKGKSGPSWRDYEAPGRRKFHGSRRDATEASEEGTRDKRAGLLKDRKGRRILVERFQRPPEASDTPPRPRGHWPRRDRSHGPRPSRPRPSGPKRK